MIAAIPTKYKGIQMRSKLEATFAASLDSFKIEWLYEPEGFDIDGTWYLPDFWLPKFSSFVEVKGILDESVEKPRKLSEQIGGRRIFLASPAHVDTWKRGDVAWLTQLARYEYNDRESKLGICPVCEALDIYSSDHCYKVYFAGKVSGDNDWRFALVPGLRTAFKQQVQWSNLALPQAIDGRHIYRGPFFRAEPRTVDLDYDGDRNSHMLDLSGYKAHDGVNGGRDDVFSECLRSIKDCDFVFAWITDETAYGTLVEIGFALAHAKPVYLGGRPSDNLWFARQGCQDVTTNRAGHAVIDPREAFDIAVALHQRIRRFARQK